MLRVEGVSVRFGAALAVDGVSLAVGGGERLSILGPSGSGKSTLLRAICGLEPLAAGRMEWEGRDLAGVPPHRRGFGLMFQDYALFPHLSVERNVAFGLEMAGAPRDEVSRRVGEALELVQLTGYRRRLPAQLSGGEQQRVALARALAPRPRLLMFDEPLGALDRGLRRVLLDQLMEIVTHLGRPIVYVTHDHEEALAVGQRVAVMRAGRLEAIRAPRDLWQRPPSEFVARFLGFVNIVDAPGRDGRRVLIRPDAFRLAGAEGRAGARHEGATGDADVLEVTVESTVFRGDHTLVRGRSAPDEPLLEIRAAWSPAPVVGDRLRLAIERDGVIELPVVESLR